MRIAWDAAAPGLQQAFQTLLSNPYAAGQDAQTAAESQIAQRLWAAEQSKAHAGKFNAEADVIRARPQLARERAYWQAVNNGFTGSRDDFEAGVTRMQQGLPGMVADSGQQSVVVPGANNAITRAMLENVVLPGVENWNPQQIAQASGEYADQNRTADMVSGRVDPVAVWRAQFANKGHNRFGVQGDEMIDQFNGFGGQTTQGQSKIKENLAQAYNAYEHGNRAKQGTQTDKYVIKEGQDDQGNPIFVRVPVQGAAGAVDTGGARPNRKRDPEDVQGNAEYRSLYPFGPGAADPTPQEYAMLRRSGYTGKTNILTAEPGAKSYKEGAVYRTPKGLMIRRAGGWEPIGGAASN